MMSSCLGPVHTLHSLNRPVSHFCGIMRKDHSNEAANSDVEILSNLIRHGRNANYEPGPSRLTRTRP